MNTGLLVAAVLAAAVFIVISLIKAIRRSERVSIGDVLLVFLLTLLPVAALLALEPAAAEAETDRIVRWIGLALLPLSVIVMLLELRRPGRLRASRGVLGVFAGLLLVLSSFSIPFLNAWFTLSAETSGTAVAVAPTPAPESTLEVEGVVSVERVQAEQLFKAIRQVLAEEIDASEVEVFTDLDAGVPLAEIVEQHGGDVARVRTRLSQLLREAVRASAQRGEISMLQGALLVSQMDLFVRFAVNSNLNDFRGFGGPTPTGTQPSLMLLLTSVPAVTELPPLATNTPQPADEPGAATSTATSTAQPTRTQRPTATPEPTRTPRPSRTPRATVTVPETPTPEFTCFAVTNYNLRLRTEPSSDAETLLTIPFAESVVLTARSADALWYATSYDGRSGWVAAEFLTPGPGCDRLEEQ